MTKLISGLTSIKYLEERIPKSHIEWDDFKPFDGFTVYNINKNKKEVGHWVLIYRNYYMDPFGNPPNDEIAKKLLDKYKSIHISTKKIQYENSDNCGNICIYLYDLIANSGLTINEVLESV
jgi:hypothetical protein